MASGWIDIIQLNEFCVIKFGRRKKDVGAKLEKIRNEIVKKEQGILKRRNSAEVIHKKISWRIKFSNVPKRQTEKVQERKREKKKMKIPTKLKNNKWFQVSFF